MNIFENWMTKKQLADYVERDQRTVERWVDAQILPPPLKMGNRCVWRKEIVDEWLKQTTYEKDCARLLKKRKLLDAALDPAPPAA